MILVLFLIFFSWEIYRGLRMKPFDQQAFVEEIEMLGSQRIYGIDILIANIEKGITERKSLTQNEITVVQELLKDADTKAIGGHNYIVYTCKLIVDLGEGRRVHFLGTNYGQYHYNKEDLYLSPEPQQEHKNQYHFYKEPKPIRIKYLGRWILSHFGR